MRALAWLLIPGLVAGCSAIAAGGPGWPRDPLAPPGPARGGPDVDPVIVGDRLLAAGEADLARASYARAATGPRGITPAIRHATARVDLAQGRLGQARAQLEAVVAAEPRNAAARNDLGVVLLETGEIGAAHAMFRSAYALEPMPGIRENLRLSGDRLAARVVDAPAAGGAVLVPRGDGTAGLETPPRLP